MTMTMTRYRAALARGVCGLAMLWALGAPASAQERQWIGEFTAGGQATPLTLHERAPGKSVTSTVDLPSMGAREVPLTRFSATADQVEFQLLLERDGGVAA